METGDGAELSGLEEFEDGFRLEDRLEEEDMEMIDAPPIIVGPDVLNDEMTRLAAGLSSQDEGQLLASLAAMQKAVTGVDGEKVLVSYVLASPQCAELMQVWQVGPGAPTAVPLLFLLYYMFQHPLGKDGADGKDRDSESQKQMMTVKLRLDKLARSIARTRMRDIYSHLSSSQRSRQNAGLLFLSAIVHRGRALAIEIATTFDFTLEALRKLGHHPKQGPQKGRDEGEKGILKRPTRVAFVEFAMSFLSVGDPGLLRWILQKRPLFAGVLHGISKDSESMIVQVLTLMQDKVMAPVYMVPRGLQSVLFGDATLQQLAVVSADGSLEVAGELAHDILLALSTDPSHGLCPENADAWEAVHMGKMGAFGGGEGRLLRLMSRLRVTEVDRHKELLLATGRTRPKLAAAYLASIPLSLEPRVSPAWFNAMSLISELIPLASKPPQFSSLSSQGLQPPTADGPLIRNILQSLLPAAFSRVALNRGLLHVDYMVKHACLRVLFEALCSLRQVLDAVDAATCVEPAQQSLGEGFTTMGMDQNLPSTVPSELEQKLRDRSIENGSPMKNPGEDWSRLSQAIQDIMRAYLPDPNTLLAILSSLRTFSSAGSVTTSTPTKSPQILKKRKRKDSMVDEGNHEQQNSLSEKYEYKKTIRQLWGPEISFYAGEREESESFLYAKVVEVLAAYQRVLPIAMADTGFDAFKLLPEDPSSLSTMQQKALMALLLASTGLTTALSSQKSRWFVGEFAAFGSAYKRLKPLLLLMLSSDVKEVSRAAYLIAHRIMASTGAFDNNPKEIAIWLETLLGWKVENFCISQRVEGYTKSGGRDLDVQWTERTILVDFLSDAVLSIGQRIYKYLDRLHSILAKSRFQEGAGHQNLESIKSEDANAHDFGPFVVSALEMCTQIMQSSKKMYEKSAVAIYVASVLQLLLKYQVDPQGLASVVQTMLSSEAEECVQHVKSPEFKFFEWAPLSELLQHCQKSLHTIINEDAKSSVIRTNSKASHRNENGQFVSLLRACQEDQREDVKSKLAALRSLLVCISVEELVENFSALMVVCMEVLDGKFSILVALLGLHQHLLFEVSKVLPDSFAMAVKVAVEVTSSAQEKMTLAELKTLVLKSVPLSIAAETSGLCALLLNCPFSVIFSAAVYGNEGHLLKSQPLASLLKAALSKVSHLNWLFVQRLIFSGIAHVSSLSPKGIDVKPLLETCFSLLYYLVSPGQLLTDEGHKSWGDEETAPDIMSAYEQMIMDLLKHPGLYNSFMSFHCKCSPSSTLSPLVDDLRRDNKDEKICDTSLRRVLAASTTSVQLLDVHILFLLKRLLEFLQALKETATSAVADYLLAFQKKILEAYKPFIVKAVALLRKEVEETSQDGVAASAALFAVSVLIPYTDLSLLMDLLSVLFSRRKARKSKQAVSSHILGLHFATVFIESSFSSVTSGKAHKGRSHKWTWEPKTVNNIECQLISDLYERVIDQVLENPTMVGDLCLLSFLQTLNLQQTIGSGLDTSCMHLQCTPLEVLRHCVSHPNSVTGSIARLLVETSSVHLLEFGWLIANGTADRRKGSLSCAHLNFASKFITVRAGNHRMEMTLSDKDLLSLLPAVQVYLSSESLKRGAKENEVASHIAAVYASFLSKQFRHWDRFVSEEMTRERYESTSLSRTICLAGLGTRETLLKYCQHSPLGQIAHLLHTSNTWQALTSKSQNRLLHSLLPKENMSLVNIDVDNADMSHLVCEALAKVNIIRQVLMAGHEAQLRQLEEEGTAAETPGNVRVKSVATEDSKIQYNSAVLQKFLASLICTLGMLYKRSGLNWKNQVTETASGTPDELWRTKWSYFLEEILLLHITDIAKELAQLPMEMSIYIPLYKQSITTLLGYRYGEISAMRAARYLSFAYLQGLQGQGLAEELSTEIDALELLIAHSKFLPSMFSGNSERMQIPHLYGKVAGKGTALNSLSSVLLLVGSPLVDSTAGRIERIVADVNEGSKHSGISATVEEGGSLEIHKRLELVKLLRILVAVRLKQFAFDVTKAASVPLQEILSILLAAYGGSMSEVDQEMFNLMNEIESHGGPGFSGLSGLDYLWGEAALKRRKSKEESARSTLNSQEEPESLDELGKRTFKEDLLIDPRRCGLTVLFFPAKREIDITGVGLVELITQYTDGLKEIRKRSSGARDRDLRAASYDPAFLLPFALHGLSIGCISTEEFVRLGLLAVAFASISSSNENMRKTGYDVLAKYYTLLEDGPSFKGRLQIRLLMTYVKNAVADSWQKLPLVFSVFAAEASCILMHPENHHYLSINRFLLRAPSLDLENIPLFQTMFGSGSLQYRSDRLWMLRLLAAGLGSSLDAHIYRRKFVLELLMSFHDSSMADTFTRLWLLQVLYQAANVRSCAQYLVEHTGVLSWLASVAVNDFESKLEQRNDRTESQLAPMALKVIESIMSWGSVQQYFLTDGMEEMSKVALMFHRFLVGNSSVQCHYLFRRPTINIMTKILHISQKRKKHQTRFTLNLSGVKEVIKWVEGGFLESRRKEHMDDRGLALKLVLQSSPPIASSIEEKLQLYEVASWAVSVALQTGRDSANDNGASVGKSPQQRLKSVLATQESLGKKLLRWLAASVVLGGFSENGHKIGTRENYMRCFPTVSDCTSAESSYGDFSAELINEKMATLLLALLPQVTVEAGNASVISVIAGLASLIFSSRSYHLFIEGDGALQMAGKKISSVLRLLLSELPCPEEINPSWLWSFSSPWTAHKNSSNLDLTAASAVEACYMTELCAGIVLIFQLLLSKRPAKFSYLLAGWAGRLPAVGRDCTDSDPLREQVRVKLAELQSKLSSTLQTLPAHLQNKNPSV